MICTRITSLCRAAIEVQRVKQENFAKMKLCAIVLIADGFFDLALDDILRTQTKKKKKTNKHTRCPTQSRYSFLILFLFIFLKSVAIRQMAMANCVHENRFAETKHKSAKRCQCVCRCVGARQPAALRDNVSSSVGASD